MEEDIDLGINPKELNETEARLITLLFTLLKYPQGLSLDRIRHFMSAHYNNENPESDQKKVQRDMDELNDLGFSAVFDKSENTYKIKLESPESKLKFSEGELKAISLALINQTSDGEYSIETYSLAQKIFGSNWSLYPFFPKEKPSSKNATQDKENIETILHAIKSKTSLQITYERSFGIPQEKELDPIQILRKNSTDLYLHAYDRKKKEFRYYIIPCIKKIFKLDNPFLLDHKISKEFVPIHALQFSNHDPITVSVRTTPTGKNHLINYLDNIKFTENNDWIEFSTTNSDALFPILIKLKESVLELQPDSILSSYRNFIDTIKSMHSVS
jgi:predicted DNA-binding transcriptional regulator YafY